MQNLNKKKYASQKGITLIALIITIIVMLILVGVTINVALNGGLFEKAETAKTQTKLAADREVLQMAVVAALNDDLEIPNAQAISNNLPEGWTVTPGADGSSYICTSPNENTFTVTADGKITEEGNDSDGGNELVAFDWSTVNLDNIDTNAYYELDTGVIYTMTFTTEGEILVNKDGNLDLIVDATDSANIDKSTGNLKFHYNVGVDTDIILTMNGNNVDAELLALNQTFTYIKKQGKTIYSNKEVLKALGITNYTGTYNGTWTKIGEENGKIKLVSTNNVASCTLGPEDPRATDPTVEGSIETGSSGLEIAIWSYKNAVSTLNAVVEDATGITLETTGGITKARSINVEDIEALVTIEKGTDYLKDYTYNYTNHKDQTFVTETGETVKIDSAEKEVTLKHTNYEDALIEDEIGILANGTYWLASPSVRCSSGLAMFGVFLKQANDTISYCDLFDSRGWAVTSDVEVRAVVYI